MVVDILEIKEIDPYYALLYRNACFGVMSSVAEMQRLSWSATWDSLSPTRLREESDDLSSSS
jgi:hypothetical protein